MTMKERLRIMREVIKRNRRRDEAFARKQKKRPKGKEGNKDAAKPVR